jgi:hypothetical protein
MERVLIDKKRISIIPAKAGVSSLHSIEDAACLLPPLFDRNVIVLIAHHLCVDLCNMSGFLTVFISE